MMFENRYITHYINDIQKKYLKYIGIVLLIEVLINIPFIYTGYIYKLQPILLPFSNYPILIFITLLISKIVYFITLIIIINFIQKFKIGIGNSLVKWCFYAEIFIIFIQILYAFL